MDTNSILSFFFAGIFLVIILALIFKNDFRDDILRNASDNSDNETTIFGIVKIKGAILVTILGFLLALVFYFGKTDSLDKDEIRINETSVSQNWIPFDLEEFRPTEVKFWNHHDSLTRDGKQYKGFNQALRMDEHFQVLNSEGEEAFSFGKISPEEIKELGFFEKLEYAKTESISFGITLSPFSATAFKQSVNYGSLPFTIKLGVDKWNTYYQVIGENGAPIFDERFSLDAGENREPNIFADDAKGKIYIIRNTDSVISKEKASFAKFEIIVFDVN